MAEVPDCVIERGVVTAPESAWDLARRRARIIGVLAASEVVGHGAVDEAATALDLSRRQVYELVARWRAGSGLVSDLIPGQSDGGRGGSRVNSGVDAVIHDVVTTRYLTRQRRSVAAVHREVTRRCRAAELPVPSRGTVVRRINALDARTLVVAREGADAARPLNAAGGQAPAPIRLLEQVQIDHTVIDLVVVDEQHRLALGRPYLTVAIDVASRAIVGLVITLEAPSATSVGLCLAHMVSDKRVWLAQLDVGVDWPMSGKPERLYLDNAAEFHSEALRRGCEQHGIELSYRPPGRPHYGGVVERVIGTVMRQVHELPGTTFSNPAQRGAYDSTGRAVLSLGELQRWLALAVASYHEQIHDTLGRPPAAWWAAWSEENGHQPLASATAVDTTAFLVDFLPIIRRTLTRTGFVVDHVRYYGDALKPLIARRERLGRFILRRDPRDISQIWVLDPESDVYLRVGYRMQSRPAISLWEQRAATSRLRELGRAEVDEAALFTMVEQMREITDAATQTTRKARRARARRPTPGSRPYPAPPCPPPGDEGTDAEVAPFAEIEQW